MLTSAPLIISPLLSLDGQLVQWASERSSHWDHTLVFDSTQSDTIYDDSYAIYQNYWISGTWNIQRMSRVSVQEAVIIQLDKMLLTTQTQTQPTSIELKDLFIQRTRALAVIYEMSSEICASVPYLLGHDKSYVEQLTNPAPAACGYFLIPSLFLAGSTMGVPNSMRIYVLGRLRYIGFRLGIQQAVLLAGILETRIEEGGVEALPRQVNRGLCEGRWGGEDEGNSDSGHSGGEGGEDVPVDEIAGRFATYMGDWEKRMGFTADLGVEMVEVV